MRDLREDDRGAEFEFFDGDPKGADPLPCQVRVAAGIVFSAVRMRRPIHFDAEPRLGAVEIEDVRSERVLATEVEALRVAAKHSPEQLLGLREVSPQRLRPLLGED